MATGSYRDLRVWSEAIELVEHVYRVTQEFPKHETFGLTSQMQRAAISVPANIAEGNTREHRKEYLHHVSLAQASLAELETHLEIAARLGYGWSEQIKRLMDKAVSLGKQLYALRNALRRKETEAIGLRGRRHSP
jgi:four helix bundle protein